MDTIKIPDLVKANLKFHQLNRVAEKNFGISIVQYHLIKIVKDIPGISPQSLARELQTHPSTLTQSIRRLLRKKAVFIAPHPKDSRKKLISLTRVGLQLIRRFEDGVAILK